MESVAAFDINLNAKNSVFTKFIHEYSTTSTTDTNNAYIK